MVTSSSDRHVAACVERKFGYELKVFITALLRGRFKKLFGKLRGEGGLRAAEIKGHVTEKIDHIFIQIHGEFSGRLYRTAFHRYGILFRWYLSLSNHRANR